MRFSGDFILRKVLFIPIAVLYFIGMGLSQIVRWIKIGMGRRSQWHQINKR